jgi:hypothetical protein
VPALGGEWVGSNAHGSQQPSRRIISRTTLRRVVPNSLRSLPGNEIAFSYTDGSTDTATLY